MMALQRGASNVYFPEVASSILIPPFSSRVYRVIREKQVWAALTSQRVNGRVPEEIIKTIATLKGIDVEQLKAAFAVIQSQEAAFQSGGGSANETQFRKAEFQALLQERRSVDDLLACRSQDIESYAAPVKKWFERITLVERLAETRVLTGFRRISPGGNVLAPLSRGYTDWLPAFRIQGEGIFLTLRTDRLRSFAAAYGGERVEELIRRGQETGRCLLELSRELVLLHTLAHLLIKRLSYEAGYGASSIRERIYCAPTVPEDRMFGLLLYTAAGDADGTLGGLVELGRPGNLERVLEGALEEARWCAADPICSESHGQGPGSLNLAACHACALIPETSCELQNRFLDRQSVLIFEGA